ncbi:MAG: hypothetical protein IIA44_05590, partial [Acidobacteria bacterium]|nr:hypothetical protein [Acidobacteriota bacterium]
MIQNFCYGGSHRIRIALLCAALLGTAASASAQGPGVASGFGIDGNLLSNSPASPYDTADDWVPGSNAAGTAVLDNAGVPIDPTNTFHSTDGIEGSDLSIFAGSNKVFEDPNTYEWKAGSTPQKTDINHALFHTRTAANGDIWIMMAGDRRATSGTSYIDFELLQSTLTKEPDGTFLSLGPHGGRTVGDLVVTLELTRGGAQATFFVQRWEVDGAAASGYNYHEIVPAAGESYAAANIDSTVWVPYGAFGSTAYEINAFAEAALNLSQLLAVLDPCIDIPTLFVRTKSSASTTATLKDFIDPVHVNLSTNPLADAGPDKELTCDITSVTLEGSSGTPNVTTSWTAFDGGHIVSGGGTFTPLVDTPGTYVLTVVNALGCISVDTAIVTEDVTPPDVNAGPDDSLLCSDTELRLSGSSVTPGAIFSWTAENGGHIVSGANSPTPLVDSSGTYILTVTDPANGCSAGDTTVVLIVPDSGPPEITCPPDTTVACDAPTDPANMGTATAIDDCDDNPVIDYSDNIVPGVCPQTYTIIRTWTATDSDGNSDTCDQTINVVDDVAPVLAGCPADDTISCADPLPLPAQVSASDNCGLVTVDLTETADLNGCGGYTGTITRRWIATDECGNADTCEQILTIVDTSSPEIVGVGADTTIECPAAPVFSNPAAVDSCDPAPTLTYQDVRTAGACPQKYSVRRTWTAADACGNTSTASQTITVD